MRSGLWFMPKPNRMTLKSKPKFLRVSSSNVVYARKVKRYSTLGDLMKNVKTIVYDYGGVISKKQNKKLVNKMCKILNIPAQQFFLFYAKKKKRL